MTVQQMEGLCGEAIGYLSRCTSTAIERLTTIHGSTIQLIRWWRQGFLKLTPKSAPAIQRMINNIITLAANKELVRSSSEQPTLDWMETPL